MTAKFGENLRNYEYQLSSMIQEASRRTKDRKSKTSRSREYKRVES